MERNFNKEQQGFTLIELMVTVSLVGILLAFAIPSLRDMVSNDRVTSNSNEFVTSLSLTRSEAVKRGSRVTMCRSSNGTSCLGAGDWQVGWVIFVDENNDGAFVAADILQIHDPLATSVTLPGVGVIGSYVSFIGNGSAQKTDGTAQSGVMTLSMNGKTRTITLTSVGRLSASN